MSEVYRIHEELTFEEVETLRCIKILLESGRRKEKRPAIPIAPHLENLETLLDKVIIENWLT